MNIYEEPKMEVEDFDTAEVMCLIRSTDAQFGEEEHGSASDWGF